MPYCLCRADSYPHPAMQTWIQCEMRDCHFAFIKVQQPSFHMILGVENQHSEADNVSTRNIQSHPVTAVQLGYTRLALVPFFSLGTRHAWHPWQPLGTAPLTLLLCYRTHKHTHTQKQQFSCQKLSKWKKSHRIQWNPFPQNAFLLTSTSPPVESWGNWCSPVGFYSKGVGKQKLNLFQISIAMKYGFFDRFVIPQWHQTQIRSKIRLKGLRFIPILCNLLYKR